MKSEFIPMKPLFSELTSKIASIVNTVFITLTPFLSVKFYLAFSIADHSTDNASVFLKTSVIR